MILGHDVHGHGPVPVVVLHEWLGDHTNYDPVRPYLDGGAFTWVFADFRGYGLSRHLGGAYTAVEAAGDVLALMDSLGHRRFAVVGHSMGGMVAQKLAALAQDRVACLVGVAPVPASGFPADEAAKARMRAVLEDDPALADAVDLRTGRRYGAGWRAWKTAAARRAATVEAQLGYLAMFTGTDFAREVAGLPVPVLAVVGEHDLPVYREPSIRGLFGRWYPDLTMAVCREAGHYPMLEAPVFLAAVLEAFIGARFGERPPAPPTAPPLPLPPPGAR